MEQYQIGITKKNHDSLEIKMLATKTNSLLPNIVAITVYCLLEDNKTVIQFTHSKSDQLTNLKCSTNLKYVLYTMKINPPDIWKKNWAITNFTGFKQVGNSQI